MAYPETFEPQNPITSYSGRGVTSQPRDRRISDSSSIKDSESEKTSETNETSDGVKLRKHRSKSSDNVSYERRIDSAPPLSFDSSSSCADLQYSYIDQKNSRSSASVSYRNSNSHFKNSSVGRDRVKSLGDRGSSISHSLQNANPVKSVLGRSTPQIFVTKTEDIQHKINVYPQRGNFDKMDRGSVQSPSSGSQDPLRSQKSRDHKLEKSSSTTSKHSPPSHPHPTEGSVTTPTSDSQPMSYGEARGSRSRFRSENYMKYLSASKTSLNTSRTSLSHSSRESINSITDQTSPVPPSPSTFRRPNLRTLGKSQSLDNPDSYQELAGPDASMRRTGNDSKWYKPSLQEPSPPVSKQPQPKLAKKLGSNFAPLPNRMTSTTSPINPATVSSTASRNSTSRSAANLADDRHKLVHNAMVHRDPSPNTSASTSALAAGGKTAQSQSTGNNVVSPTKHLQNGDPLHATLSLHDNPLEMSRERERNAAIAASVLLGIKLSPSENDLLSRLAMEENPQAGYLKRKMREDLISPSHRREKSRDRAERHKKKKKSRESITSEKKHKRDKSKDRTDKKSPTFDKKVKYEDQKKSTKGYLDTSEGGRQSRSTKTKSLPRQDSDTSAGKLSKREKISGFFGSVLEKGKKAFHRDPKKDRHKSDDSVLSDNVFVEPSPKPSPRVHHTGVQTLPETPESSAYASNSPHSTSGGNTCSGQYSPKSPLSDKGQTCSQSPVAALRAEDGVRARTSSLSTVRAPARTPRSSQEVPSSTSGKLPKAAARRQFFASMKSSSLGNEPASNREEQSPASPVSPLAKEETAPFQGKDTVNSQEAYTKPVQSGNVGSLEKSPRKSGSGPVKDGETRRTEPTIRRYFETEIDKVSDIVISSSHEQPVKSENKWTKPLRKEEIGNKPNSISPDVDDSKKPKDAILLNYYTREKPQVPTRVTEKPSSPHKSQDSRGSKLLNGQINRPANKMNTVKRYFDTVVDKKGETIKNAYSEKPPGNRIAQNVPGTKSIQGTQHNKNKANNNLSTKGDNNNSPQDQVPDIDTHLIRPKSTIDDANIRTDYKEYGDSGPNSRNSHNNGNPSMQSEPEKWYEEILQRQKGMLSKQTTEESETTTVSEISESDYYDSPRESPLKSPEHTGKDHMRDANGHRVFSPDSGSETSYISAESIVDSTYIEEQNKLLSALQNTKFLKRNKRKRKMNKAQSFDSADIDSFVTNVVEQERTRVLREKHMEEKNSSDTDEGIVKDKMEQLKRPLNVDIDDAKLQETLSSPGDSALGTPSSSVVSNMKVDENALDEIQNELAQAIKNENKESKEPQISNKRSPDHDPKGEMIQDTFHAHTTPSIPPSKQGKSGKGKNTLDQDTYLMYSINDKGAEDKSSAGATEKNDDFEYISEEDKNVPQMDYVSKVNVSVSEMPNTDNTPSVSGEGKLKVPKQKSNLAIPSNERPSLSPVNELSESGSNKSSSDSKDNAEGSTLLQQKEISSIESPSQRLEGEKPKYDTYDIVEESSLTSMDRVVKGAMLTEKARQKFLKLLEPKPKPYEPIFNTRAHPYKNFREDDDEAMNTNNKETDETEPDSEDPEAEGYEPTNMLRELVLLKSAGFDLNDDKVKQFIDLKNELDENKDDKNETPNSSDQNTKTEEKDTSKEEVKDNLKDLTNNKENSNLKDNAETTVNETVKDTEFEKGKNTSGIGGTSKENLEGAVTKKEMKPKTENKDKMHQKKLDDRQISTSNSLKKESTDSVLEEAPEDGKAMSSPPKQTTENSGIETQERAGNNNKKVNIERHVSFSEEPPVVYDMDTTSTQTEGDTGGLANFRPQKEDEETDEPVFVVSSFDTFLQQLYINMGM